MVEQGYACLIWDRDVSSWSSLACSVDRDRLEALAERLREICHWPARVVECELMDEEMILLRDPVGSPVVSDVIELVDDDHAEGDPNG